MGTRGLRVYRRKGWYFVYYNPWDSYPEGLGVEVMAEIPVEEENYNEWLFRRREELDQIFEENQAAIDQDDQDENFYITRKRLRNTIFIEWIYEIDFDHEVLLVDSYPLFSLKNMPRSEDLFCECIGLNSYGYRGYSASTPKQHIFDWKSPPPGVEDSVVEEYAARHGHSELTIADLLGTTPKASDAESARVGLLEIIIGGHMQWSGLFGIEIQDLETISDPADIPRFTLRWGEQVLRLAFGRMLFGYDEKVAVTTPAGLDFWLASDVFVRVTTHLDDERNRKKNIVDIVDEIARRRQTTTVIYGVLFSFFHCVILEVDAQNRFRSTSVLQFLPSLYTTSPSTSGIAAIARLAHHRLSSLEILGKPSSPLPPGHFLHDVPLELLECITPMLGPTDLQNLCTAAPVFRPAAERVLRFPHIKNYRLECLLEEPDQHSEYNASRSAKSRLYGNFFLASVDGAFVPCLHVRASQATHEIMTLVVEAKGRSVEVAFAKIVDEEED